MTANEAPPNIGPFNRPALESSARAAAEDQWFNDTNFFTPLVNHEDLVRIAARMFSDWFWQALHTYLPAPLWSSASEAWFVWLDAFALHYLRLAAEGKQTNVA